MSLGFGPTGGRPIAGESAGVVTGRPLAVKYTHVRAIDDIEFTDERELDVEFTNDTTLAVEYETGVEAEG